MKVRRIAVATLIVAGLLGAGFAVSEEVKKSKEQAAMEEAWMKSSQPGEHHRHLKQLAGRWKLEVKNWFADPAGPPEITQGTANVAMIMGDRYLREEVKGEMAEGLFEGMGVTGYDNVKKKYVSTWVDNMGSGIMVSEGACEGGRVFNWTGKQTDPMTGKESTSRMVSRIVDDSKHIFEMYGKSPDGKEFKMLEITYTRM